MSIIYQVISTISIRMYHTIYTTVIMLLVISVISHYSYHSISSNGSNGNDIIRSIMSILRFYGEYKMFVIIHEDICIGIIQFDVVQSDTTS